MGKFKVGDKVQRKLPVTVAVTSKTGVKDGEIYTVSAVAGPGVIFLKESKEEHYAFLAAGFDLAVGSGDWDIQEALRLRGLAVRAVEEYNMYLLRQPLLDPIDIPPIK